MEASFVITLSAAHCLGNLQHCRYKAGKAGRVLFAGSRAENAKMYRQATTPGKGGMLYRTAAGKPDQADKPPAIVSTDIGGDPDDEQSLVRFLLYANKYDIKALCAASSLSHGQKVHPEVIKGMVPAYGKVYPNLAANAKGFPPPAYLQSLVYAGQGNQADFGKGYDTDASDRIIKVVNASDETVNILIWGGQRELAQALWKVRTTN